MKRINFLRTLAAGGFGTSVFNPSTSASVIKPVKRVLMKVGCQSGGTSEENLMLKSRCGANNQGGNKWASPITLVELDDSKRKN